jgi:hypothetical protein
MPDLNEPVYFSHAALRLEVIRDLPTQVTTVNFNSVGTEHDILGLIATMRHKLDKLEKDVFARMDAAEKPLPQPSCLEKESL